MSEHLLRVFVQTESHSEMLRRECSREKNDRGKLQIQIKGTKEIDLYLLSSASILVVWCHSVPVAITTTFLTVNGFKIIFGGVVKLLETK